MLSVMAAWLYIGLQSLIFGSTIEYGISVFLEKKRVTSAENGWESLAKDGISISRILFCGITFLSVYGTVFSFFGGLGLAANLVLTALDILCFILLHRVKKQLVLDENGQNGPKAAKKNGFTVFLNRMLGEGNGKWCKISLILLGFLVLAYFSSRGYEHYDTMLYHAQAIHYLEDYGTITGLGNVYFRYAYNSAGFVLTALFSFAFLGGKSLHCISGLFAFFLWIGIIEDWHLSFSRKWQTSDLIRIGAIYYISMILNEIVSPASDYPTMLLVFFIFLKYTLALEREENLLSLGKLCVLACFAVTLKTSAAPIVLLTLYPAVRLLQKKDVRKILGFISMGLLVVGPYLFRNFLLSGYLLYPSEFLSTLAPSWQMKAEIARMDAAEISAWGKGIEYEPDWNLSFGQWFPIWMSRQKTGLEKMLMLMGMGCSLPVAGIAIGKLFGKKREPGRSVAFFTILVSFWFWVLMAPLPRYGWCYLFLLPILFAGVLLEVAEGWEEQWCERKKKGSKLRILPSFCILVLAGLCLWKGAAACKLFMSNCKLPYYLEQQDYSSVSMKAAVKATPSGENMVFYEPENGFYGYYDFPAVKSVEDFTMRGENIRDGFEAVK